LCVLVRIVVTIVFTVAMFERASLAAEWYVVPTARVSSEYNDNPSLLSSGGTAVWGGDAEVAAKTGVRTALTKVDLLSRLRFLRFPSEEKLNSNDQFFDLNASHRLENTELSLFGNYSRDGTRTSELEDTGIVQFNKRRIGWSLAPRVVHHLTQRTGVDVSLDYSDVKYDDSALTGLIDYTFGLADGSVVHQLSERDLLRAGVLFTRYDAPDQPYKANGYGIMGGIDHSFSDTLHGKLKVGFTSYEMDFSTGGVPESGSTFVTSGLAEISKEFERTTLTSSLSNTVRPSGSGQLRERAQLLFAVQHKLTSQLSGYASVQLFRDTSLLGGTSPDRKFVRFETWIRHQIAREWSFKATYRYLSQEETGVTADSNSIFLAFVYGGPKYATSR
ncbi:MAG: hypothetical protein E4H01_11775, partial [Lysobacterales bacterium]